VTHQDLKSFVALGVTDYCNAKGSRKADNIHSHVSGDLSVAAAVGWALRGIRGSGSRCLRDQLDGVSGHGASARVLVGVPGSFGPRRLHSGFVGQPLS
jgi:hypothetical protein